MALMVDIGGAFINPLNVDMVEEAEEERETKREGLVVSKSVIKVVNVIMASGAVKTVEAVSSDPEVQRQLLRSVVQEINIGLNTSMTTVTDL